MITNEFLFYYLVPIQNDTVFIINNEKQDDLVLDHQNGNLLNYSNSNSNSQKKLLPKATYSSLNSFGVIVDNTTNNTINPLSTSTNKLVSQETNKKKS